VDRPFDEVDGGAGRRDRAGRLWAQPLNPPRCGPSTLQSAGP